MRVVGHWINGQESSGHSTDAKAIYNPATGQEQASVLLATPNDVEDVVQAAVQAFDGWSQSPLSVRTKVLFAFREIMNRRSDELASIITDEHGKTIADAAGEVQRGLEVVEFACGIPQLLKGEYSDQVSSGVDLFSYRQPLGVVVGITPFNFPAMVPMWMFPIAIACGNTFILKPSERDPSAANFMAGAWKEAGLPDGVFNVIHGDVVAVNALCDHPDVRAVSFVGSTPVARQVHARSTASGKRVQALGGAKNHSVVLPDANVDFAAHHIISAAFGSAGERCMAISATLAVGDIGAELSDRLAQLASEIKVGSGRDASTEMGPVISAASRDRIVDLISQGENQGAKVTIDGRNPSVPGFENGFFVGPTLLDDVTTNMAVYQEEIFGPVLSLLHTNSAESAIAMINANPYGNGTAIFTSNGETARQFHRGVNVGMIGINVPVPVPMAYYSFGGWKDSLFGERHVHGPEGVSFYTRGKVVTARWPEARHSESASLSFPTP